MMLLHLFACTTIKQARPSSYLHDITNGNFHETNSSLIAQAIEINQNQTHDTIDQWIMKILWGKEYRSILSRGITTIDDTLIFCCCIPLSKIWNFAR
jgi:hypothetical protein